MNNKITIIIWILQSTAVVLKIEPKSIEFIMTAKEIEVSEEYSNALADLNINSKPLINMLTMLAEENSAYAPIIVQCIERQLHKVFKLHNSNEYLTLMTKGKHFLFKYNIHIKVYPT